MLPEACHPRRRCELCRHRVLELFDIVMSICHGGQDGCGSHEINPAFGRIASHVLKAR